MGRMGWQDGAARGAVRGAEHNGPRDSLAGPQLMLLLLLLLLLSHFSRVRLCDPRDGSLPDFPTPGILQTRTLEWVTISFSNA